MRNRILTTTANRYGPEYDIVHIRQQGAKVPKWNLTKPLLPDTKVKLGYGATVPASELIGRNYLDTLHDSDGRKLILHEPTFTSYILLSQRIATPVRALFVFVEGQWPYV